MHPLAALALIGASWLAVRPRPCRIRHTMKLDDVEIALFTRGLTVVIDGKPGGRIGGPDPDIEAAKMMAAVAFEAQLKAVFKGAKRA